MSVLGWMELSEDDQPPDHIWLNDEALQVHFEQLREKWKNPGSEAVPAADMNQNELTKGLR